MKKLTAFLCSLLILWSCSEDDSADPIQQADLPDELTGVVVELQFSTADSGPYQMGDLVEFAFSSSGALFITDASNNVLELSSFVQEGSEYVWDDTENAKRYAVSLTSEGEINEINYLESTNSFLGQFVPVAGNDELSLIIALAGDYTISSVDEGSHNRMTIAIDAQGTIDFDTDLSFSADDYELITDRRDCCDGIWVDMSPYPSEPYGRLELYVDTSGGLSEIYYYPEYPNVSGRVKVKL